MTHEPFTDEERALRDRLGLDDPPPPRRTDAAFARAVGDAARVGRTARVPRLLVGGAALAGALAVAVLAVGPLAPPPGDAVVALAAVDLEDDGPSFAAPDFDEVDDASLLALNHALDRALARKE